MLKTRKIVLVLLVILLLNGCVSSKKYNARLYDIENMKEDISDLEENLSSTEAELFKLRKDYKEVSLQKDTFSEEADALRSKLSESNSRVSDLEEELERVSNEKVRTIEAREEEISRLKKTYNDLVSELKGEIKEGEVVITQLKDKLSLSMVDKILFDSGSALIKKDGKKVLDRVAEIISKVSDKEIRVEGHTDNVPIGYILAEKFQTNWELSTARATNVVRYLQESGGIDPKVLSAAGYSEYRPVAPNDSDEGKAKNRRIEIILVPLGLDRLQTETNE